MIVLKFTVPGLPTAKGRPQFVRRGKFVKVITPTKTRNAERNFLAIAYQHRPPAPFTGPVKLRVRFYFPIPRSWPGWKKVAVSELEDKSHIHKTSKPDASNLLKLCEDAMIGVFYIDDSQLIEVNATKAYSNIPRTEVEIETVKVIRKKKELELWIKERSEDNDD